MAEIAALAWRSCARLHPPLACLRRVFIFPAGGVNGQAMRPEFGFSKARATGGKSLAKNMLRFSLVMAAGLQELLPLIYSGRGFVGSIAFLA